MKKRKPQKTRPKIQHSSIAANAETENQKISDILYGETDFSRYLDLLIQYGKKYMILVAVKDTPCGSPQFTADLAVKLMHVGFTIPLHNKYRCSYAAINDAGKLVFEGISQTHPVRCEFNLDGIEISLESICFCTADGNFSRAKIIISGTNYAVNHRGISIVVFDKTIGSILDIVSFDTYAQSIPCIHLVDGKKTKEKFMKQHPEVTFISGLGVPFPENNRSEYERFVVENVIRFDNIIASNGTLRTPLDEYIDTPDGIREVLTSPLSYIGTDGARHCVDVSGKYLNIVNGHRLTIAQPENPKRVIYIVGHCNILGIGVRDCGTLASWLQVMLNEQASEQGFIVENYGLALLERDPCLDMTALLKTLPLKPGDIVIGYGGLAMAVPQSMMRPHNHGELFFDIWHYTEKCNQLIASEYLKTLQEHNYFSDTINMQAAKPIDEPQKKNYGFSPEMLAQLEQYKSTLAGFYEQQFGQLETPPKIGAIVMNCNPFTLGHRYLIEQCTKEVDFLMVFVVQEDKSFFPFEDRIDLVDKGTADLSNVGIIESGNFIISTQTFSFYFNKEALQDMVIDSSKDVTLFAREIAPSMHISVRFAGTEPFDRVTKQYNQTLSRILPQYGIEFKEIARTEIDGEAISASRVRALLEQRDWTAIAKLVPPTTLAYLQNKFK